MKPFLYRCPVFGLTVQSFVADTAAGNDADDSDESYESIACIACNGVHLVNSKTGKVLGADS